MIGIKDNVIPEMIHPLGKYWQQPNRDNILIDDTHALMSIRSLGELYEYSMSIPTGVYEGKMWKACFDGAWFLKWYGVCEDPDKCNINMREIIIADAKQPLFRGEGEEK